MTDNINVRQLYKSDLPIIYQHQLDPEACRVAAFPSRNWDAFIMHYTKIMADPSNRLRTILLDGQVVGSIGSYIIEGKREVGYWIGREYWGRGIATRALQAFLKEEPIRPLYAHVTKHNTGSIRVLEKCGFVQIGEDSYTPVPGGEVVDEFVMALK
jgi:RimJ/RimL family protein N-acetyltransferase